MLHESTFEYLKPTVDQIEDMSEARRLTKEYANAIDLMLTDNADKTYIIRRIRETAMWINVAITRYADGTPRTDED